MYVLRRTRKINNYITRTCHSKNPHVLISKHRLAGGSLALGYPIPRLGGDSGGETSTPVALAPVRAPLPSPAPLGRGDSCCRCNPVPISHRFPCSSTPSARSILELPTCTRAAGPSPIGGAAFGAPCSVSTTSQVTTCPSITGPSTTLKLLLLRGAAAVSSMRARRCSPPASSLAFRLVPLCACVSKATALCRWSSPLGRSRLRQSDDGGDRGRFTPLPALVPPTLRGIVLSPLHTGESLDATSGGSRVRDCALPPPLS